jgi:hypothetical protein
MAAIKKTLTTPFGKSEWFSLTKTDKFSNYTCSIVLDDSPETHKLISEIDSVAGADFDKKPYEKQADGSYKLKLKGKSKGTKKTGETYVVNPPVLYNSLNAKIEGQELLGLNVGNGSEIRAKIEVSSYVMVNQETQEVMKGISCKIKSAQLGKIVAFQNSDDDLGFDALEMAVENDSHGESPADNFDF